MPFASNVKRLLGVALIAAATTTAVGGMLAAPRPDTRLAFRRPADLVDTGGAEQDAVWRLGRRLFFETELSKSGKMSCATCHQVGKAWSDANPKAIGDGGRALPFKAPTLFNVGWLERLGWTGKFRDTASVALFAMGSASNMNMPLTELTARLRADPSYVTDFGSAFSHATITGGDVGVAITRYVNSITSSRSTFDDWVDGDQTAIAPDAKRGFAVFTGKARCSECHRGWTFTDGSFHDIGTTQAEPGRGALFATSIKLQHAFKTPTLRGVAERAPYMHDGSVASLDQVIDLYDRGGIDRPSRADAISPLHLSAEEKADLKAFLLTLSGSTDFVIHP